MKFVILRVLTHSELGMFHEYRRQGKEGSKQRAINFDSAVVDRVFPAATDSDRIPLSLTYDTDSGPQVKAHWLARQAKNWRLEGNCPQDRLYSFVDVGSLFAMDVDAGKTVASGAWAVFPKDHPVTRAVMGDGSTAGLTGAGMIALHDEEGDRVREILSEIRPDLFAPPERAAHRIAAATDAAPAEPTQDEVIGGKRLRPRPQRLAEIIGGTGHTLATAVADIVDNSVSVDATEIDITFSPPNSGLGRWLSIRDNGWGMNEDELAEAMTLGSEVTYDENNLGKFGYGLKGASWSQARLFTVVSRRRDTAPTHLTWDKENLGDWVASDGPLEAWEGEQTKLDDQGTVVLWKDMKPPAATPQVPGVESPYQGEITALNRHLGLVFHRFIEGKAQNRKKVVIRINGTPVEPNNPVGHPLAVDYDQKALRVPVPTGDVTVTVQPWLMPSEDEIKAYHRPEGPAAEKEALQREGLYGKRNDSQGLFIYRNDRLIKWGGWHEIWTTNDEKTKLARVIVSFFGPKLDRTFDINITKRSVSLPAFVQEEIKKLASPVRKASQAKYVRKSTPTPTPVPPTPPTPGPTRPGGPVPVPPTRPAPTPSPGDTPVPLPETMRLRPVTTGLFAWKVALNLGGGRDLQVSSKIPELQTLANRLSGDEAAIAELAAFLQHLDAHGLQDKLLRSDPEG